MCTELGIESMPKGNWVEFNDPTLSNTPEANATQGSKAHLQIKVQRVRNKKGGKTITVISGLGLNNPESLLLLKKFKARLGTGGTLKGDNIEIQGDQVEMVMDMLKIEGYRPKQSGS